MPDFHHLNQNIVFPQLQVQKMNIWNECLTYLGINNANTDKKERLISNEVDANDQLVEACGDIMLKARKEACERINKLFGTNISVERRTQIKANLNINIDEKIDTEEQGGDLK